MQITDILLEDTIKTNPIYEDAFRAGQILIEKKLSPEEIKNIFQTVADRASKGENDGSNRTTLGKGADVASSVSQAFDKVKTKISQSGPVSGFDSAVDNLQSKILDAAGGDAGAVGKAISSYREFAKKHPVMQGAVYAGLIALAGISGAGVGGASLLGGIKVFDRLLQGDKASSALWKGFKTGATAYAAGQIGKAMQGDKATTELPKDVKSPQNAADLKAAQEYMSADPATKADILKTTGMSDAELKNIAKSAASDVAGKVSDITNPQYQAAIKAVQGDPSKSAEYKKAFIDALKDEVKTYGTTDPANMRANIEMATDAAVRAVGESVEYIDRRSTVWTWALNESLGRAHGGVMVTPAGVTAVFEGVVAEGPFSSAVKAGTDKVKGALGKAAGAVGGAMKQGWVDATNKITYNKLDLNWRKGEGRDQTGPVDSEVLAAFLRKQGVTDNLISTVYKSMRIPTPGATTKASSGDRMAAKTRTGSKATTSDGEKYTWKGAQWVSDTTGKIATRDAAKELSKNAKAKAAKARATQAEPTRGAEQEPELKLSNPTLSGIAKGLAGQSSSAGSRADLGDTTEAKRALRLVIDGKPLEPYHIQALKALLKKL